MNRFVKSLLLLVLLTMAFTGCASHSQWAHSSKTQGDLVRDREACEKKATRDAYGSPIVNHKVLEECMRGRGWTKR